METLLEKFKKKVKSIDSSEVVLPIPEAKPTKVKKLFNIFKRSLPVGLNKLVFQNVTEDDIKLLFRHFLRPKTKSDGPVLYYDAIEAGTAEEWNVFSNEGIDTTGDRPNINTYRGIVIEPDWKG